MPQITIDFPEETGQFVPQWWQENFELEISLHHDQVVITGDAAGLRNLAAQLLALAQDYVYSGCHVHLDADNVLENGSVQVILQRK
jgi:hypothetical protein